jgi:hypothetical protein
MKTRAHRLLLIALLLGCGAACNQKDPVQTGNSYFPLRDDATWKYLHSKNGWVETVTVHAVDGEDATFDQEQTGSPDGDTSTSRLELRDGDVLRVAEEQRLDGDLDYTVVYDPGFLRFSEAWLERDPGDTETHTYERTETKAGQPAKDPESRAHIYTIESLTEEVTVPAGTFQNCLRVRRQRDLTGGDAEADAGASEQSEQDKLFWFAAGVGKVREENTLSGSTEELIEYDVGEEP